MTINDFSERLKTVKAKDTKVLFRTEDRKTLTVGGMFYGIENADGSVTTPQVGEEPNCVVVQVTAV